MARTVFEHGRYRPMNAHEAGIEVDRLMVENARLQAALTAQRPEQAGSGEVERLRELAESARARMLLLNSGCDDYALQDEIMDILTSILGPLPGDRDPLPPPDEPSGQEA